MLAKSKLLILTLLTLLNTAVFAAVDTQYSATMCGAQKYLFGCQVLTPADGSGNYSYTLGDSTVHLNLLFAPIKATAYDATIEPGETYLFGCQLLTADDDVSNTLQQVGCTCDSTVTVKLKVQAPSPTPQNITVSYEAQINKGETYLFGCELLTEAKAYTRTINRVNGGDSIINLTLSYADTPAPQNITVSYEAQINKGEIYLFGCQQLTEAKAYTRTIDRVNGGDSIINLTLSYTPAPQNITVSYEAQINKGEIYLFGCEQLTEAKAYTRTIDRVNGGDSIINLTLSYADTPQPETVKVQYDADIELGEIYLLGCRTYQFSETGLQTLTDTLPRIGVDGDSIVIVNLTVGAGGSGEGDTVRVKYEAYINEGETYLFGCRALTDAGLYSDTLARMGGDSIVTLDLKFNVAPVEPDTVRVKYDATIEEGQIYLFGCKQLTIGGQYSDTLARMGGDSIVTLKLTVNEAPVPTDTAVAYDATIGKGETYLFGCALYTTAGTYSDTLTRALGGDSIVFLHLTVKETVYGDTTALECDSLIWYEHIIKVTGDYEHTFTNIVPGRDSVVTMHATINYSTIAAEPEAYEGCNSVVVYGKTYTVSDTYTDTLTNVAGCDSIITLNITVHNTTGNYYDEDCDSIIYKGKTYYETSIFYDTLPGQSVFGCDSIVTVILIVNTSSQTDTTAVECESFTWRGKTYTESGDYNDTTNTSGNCTSIVTLHLTILQPSTGDTIAVECESFTWHGTTYTESGIYKDTLPNAVGCDSVVTLHLTIHKPVMAPLDSADECNLYVWRDELYTETGMYYDTLLTADGLCDSVIYQLKLKISVPFDTTLSLIHKFGDRLLMINRNEINQKDGWLLDSLGLEHPEYVTWYEIDLNGNTKVVGQGYYYTLPNGEPLPSGYTYYAVINIAPSAGEKCGARGETEHYTIPAHGAPALLPSLARPGQGIQVVNLVPEEETVIRVFSADGQLLKTYTTTDAETFMIEAEYNNGFYMVELRSNYIKTTLRYIVK